MGLAVPAVRTLHMRNNWPYTVLLHTALIFGAAEGHTDEINGLVLMYPAFLVSDAIHEQFDSLEEVPDRFPFVWITAGRLYAEDMWNYDVYEEIGNYTDKVLLMHGNADSIVPISMKQSGISSIISRRLGSFILPGVQKMK